MATNPADILGLPKPAWAADEVGMLYDMATRFMSEEIAPRYDEFEKNEMVDRESWLKRLAFMQSRGVKFNMRVNHGVTHSVYINDPNGYGVELLYELPRQMWEHDIDAGLNYLALLPTEGPEALVDDLGNVRA